MPEFLWTKRESAGRRALLLPLWLLEGPYRLGAWLHRRMYSWGLRTRVRLEPGVVSVGNLCVGGSGKTPLVAWLARELHARGHRVAILSRGVGARRAREVNVVSDGERVLLGSAEAGDEPVLLARRARGVPVLSGRNRVALGLRAFTQFASEVLILDDGFQHHRLERDVDLVCIDARTALGNGHVLPRGPLREPAGALRHADAILWTRAPQGAVPLPPLPRSATRARQFRVSLVACGLRRIGDGCALEPVGALAGRKLGLLCAIARPDRLRADLAELGASVVAQRIFPDHHRYRRSDLEALDPSLPWLTTEKDAVKIPAAWARGVELRVLEEELRSEDGDALVDFVLQGLARQGSAP